MKKEFLILALSILCATARAQFTLSGRIKNYTGAEQLKINIPLVFNDFSWNDTNIPVAKDGSFSIVLPVKAQKFASFIFLDKSITYLLTPGKTLNVICTTKDTLVVPLAGSSLPENKLLTDLDIEEYPKFFSYADQNSDKLQSLENIKELIVKPYYAQRDAKILKVNTSAIPNAYKKLIASEIYYNALLYLNDFARTSIKDRKLVNAYILYLYDNESPAPKVFPAGPQYYAFAQSYIYYLETKAFLNMQVKKQQKNEPIDFFNVSLDSATKLVEKFGKPYWRWLGAVNNLPLNITEQLTYQEIAVNFHNKDLKQLKPLAEVFSGKFPASKYLNDISLKVLLLEKAARDNESNNAIYILKNYDTIASIYDVVKSLKGKVVYLDVWGTWCGPCKDELEYIPQLKAKFKDKEVAYVYLDMDEAKRDNDWKTFIRINAMEGTHLRKSSADIQPFWKELLKNEADKAQSYPRYFLFDKEGKLAVVNALRPSDKELLYSQILSILAK